MICLIGSVNRPPAMWRARVLNASWQAAVVSLVVLSAAHADDGEAVISGVVIDTADQPVAGATVWLLGGLWDDELLRRRAESTTDENGRFAFRPFSADELFQPARGQQLPRLMARDERRRLGWVADLRAPNAQNVKLKLHEIADFHGMLVDSSSKPIGGASIRVQTLGALSIRDRDFDSISLTADLAREWQTNTDAEGAFTLPNVPADGSLTAVIAAAGYGNPRVHWDLANSVSLRLDPAGSIAGSIELPEGVQQPEMLTLELRRQSQPRDDEEQFRLYYHASAPVTDEGRFEFPDVPPGVYVINLEQNRHCPVYADPTAPITLSAGGRITDVKLPLMRAVVVRGVAVDNRDKKPVKGVTLRFSAVESSVRRAYGADETTDENGRFTAYVRPGKLMIEPWLTPPGFLPALGDAPPEAIDAERDIEPIVEIERAIEVRGVVVDEKRKPVPNAELHLIVPRRGFRFDPPTMARADDSGGFVLKDVDPADDLPLRARSATAVTDGVVLLAPEQLLGPIRLVVGEADVCRLVGRVVDESGSPLAHVRVGLRASRAYESKRIPMRGLSTTVFVEAAFTDDRGRFVSGPLWPRDSYQASVAVDGYGRAESKRSVGKAGETIDVGAIVLRRNDGFVAGVVVDSAGKPVEGVTVFNSGDGLQPASVLTDATGRFRLERLFGGPVYVFACKAGYRFSGLRATSGAADVELTLLRGDEPPPNDQPAAPRDDATEHEQLARWMLEQFWAVARQNDKWLLIRYMARIDPGQAANWSAQLGGGHDGQVMIGTCERIEDLSHDPNTRLDVDDALAAISGLSDDRAVRLLIKLAERTLPRRREDSQRFSEEALLRLRKLQPPQRVYATAQVGSLLTRLGRAEAGRKLLGEAAGAAEQLTADGAAAFARGMVARELASYDLPRAKKLIEPISAEAGRARYLGWLAESLAERELNQALAVVAQIRGDLNAESLANQTRMKIAYRIAAARPDDALRVVEAMAGHGAEKVRAEALSWLAVQIAPSDKRLASKLIDRSLAIYLDKPEEFSSWGNYGGRPVLAAWVARQAREVGYPDMRSVVMRVLATRPTQREEYDPLRRLEATVATAWVLAFTDPRTSRDLLKSVEPFGDLIGSGYTSIHRGEWLNAWALADPEHAKQVFEQELAAVVRGNPDLDLQRAGLLRSAEMLSQPRSQWPRHLLINFGPFWLPGEE